MSYFIEDSSLNPGFGPAFSKDKVLYSKKSRYQHIEVFENRVWGKVLVLDGLVMFSEKDEFVYHEMISHVPMAVSYAKRILIIGGGDGGAAKELVKYPSVEKIDIVEIDEDVPKVSKDLFPYVASALDSDKVNLKIQDGADFVSSAKRSDRYDLIIVDSTDPIGPGERLFTEDFFSSCKRLLSLDGIMVSQSEAPFLYPEQVMGISKKLKKIFPISKFYMYNMPTYPSGLWLFGFSSKKLHPINDLKEKEWEALGIKTRYYNTKLHRAAFALPNFMRALTE